VTGAWIALAWAFGSMLCHGQNAQLSGLIQDLSKLGVSGADVSIRNEQTGGRRTTKSNALGFYNVPSLAPGEYRATIRASGFDTVVRSGIKLEVGENARIDFDLRIGDSGTTITVTGGPPLMNTEDASVGTVIDRATIDQMPLNGRGIQSLIELSPGVVAVPVSDPSGGQFVVNGQRNDANYFTVDGVSANFGSSIPLSSSQAFAGTQIGSGMITANNFFGTFSNLVTPDALQEFRIQTSTFAPEFGRAPGAQIGMVTRSGANRYSGSLFEFVRNDRMDANDWFTNQQALPRSPLRFNNFGGTLSGPIQIPHLYDGHNRTFFFLSSDNILTSQPQPGLSFPVPTVQARQAAPLLVALLLNAYPIPNRPAASSDPAGFAEYAGTYPFLENQEALSVRLDHGFGDRLMSFVRYNRAPSQQLAAAGGGVSTIGKFTIQTETLTFGLTQILAPNIVNEIRLNGSRESTDSSSSTYAAGGAQTPPDSLFFPPGYSSRDSEASFDVAPAPYIQVGRGYRDRARQLEGLDNFSWNLGAHQLKFGADYRWYSPAETIPRLIEGFNSPGLNGSYGPGGEFSGADSGIIAGVTQVFSSVPNTAFVIPAFSAYVQDTWKASRKLTLTYGLRWEVDPGPRVSAGQAGIATGLPNEPLIPVPAGTPVYATSWTDFAPRLGLAWQLRDGGSSKTVLRIGGGQFFDLGQSGFEGQGFNAQTAFGYFNQPLGSLTGGTLVSQNSGETPLTQGAVRVATPGYKPPYTWEWNATAEQSIGQQTFSAGYIGALGRRLTAWSLYPQTCCADALYLSNGASSSYNALQLQFNRRLSTRLHMLVSYTWSHSIDNLSSDQGYPLLGLLSFDPRDKGSSDFDIRRSLNGSIIADLPSPREKIANVLFRNWTANSIFFARTALPTDLRADLSGDRPNVVPGQPLYLYGSEFPGGKSFNGAAFSVPPTGTNGDLGRNVLRGLGAWQIDFAVHREFRLAERLHVQFRAEFFNILNHPNFANPSNFQSPGVLTLSPGPGFGSAMQTLANGLNPLGVLGGLSPLFQVGGPRTTQLALRLRF
jgi:Carboxypeptidase regulatory-like domain